MVALWQCQDWWFGYRDARGSIHYGFVPEARFRAYVIITAASALSLNVKGALRELPITDGWNILDDNILACSEKHIRAVFDMLKRLKHRPEFTEDIEAKLLNSWHIELFRQVRAIYAKHLHNPLLC